MKLLPNSLMEYVSEHTDMQKGDDIKSNDYLKSLINFIFTHMRINANIVTDKFPRFTVLLSFIRVRKYFFHIRWKKLLNFEIKSNPTYKIYTIYNQK